MRERMQPKMGKIDIDYQILHDAFFKNQKKSRMSDHGEVYHEGKEYEINTRVYKPGMISPAL
jgi:splicing factor 3B subunit 2